MYFRLCVFAVVLALTWYHSDLGYLLVQLSCCALWCLTGGSHSKVSETSTQTDRVSDEPQQKSDAGHIVGRDEPDTRIQAVQKECHQSQYPNIHRSLQHMFKCAYSHLVLPWSTASDLGDSQPLHTALLTEFNVIMDEIIYKAKDVDLSVTALGSIQILTQHLRNIKKSEGSPAFSSKAEEIAVVKGFCKALIHSLIPKHLWEPSVYYCVLQEILAVKALEFVSLLSDPDNLNNLIIFQLDQIPTDKQMEEVQDSDREVSSFKGSESSDVLQDEAEEHPSEEDKAKKKGKKLKELFTKGLKRIKPKKPKIKRGKELSDGDVPRRTPAAMRNEDTSSNEGSICDNVDTDLGTTSYSQEEMMEFKLSYEMWKAGNWAVTVTKVQMEENELCFTVHLEEINNPENLHWDVQKNQSDVIHFYNLCKEKGSLPSLSTLVEKPKTEWKKEEATEILEHSLQDLLKNAELSNSELVFKFLGPIDWIQHEEHDEWFWVLLEGIASFLRPGQDDDELSDYKEDKKQHKVMYDYDTSKTTPLDELDDTQPVCTDTLEKQEPDHSMVADEGHLPTPEENSTCTNEGHITGYIDHLTPESASVNISQVASKMKYIKFDSKFTRQAAAMRKTENDEKNVSHDDVSVCNHEDDHLQSSEMEKPERREKEPYSKELSQPSGETKMCSSSELEANKVIFDLLKEISGNSYTFKLIKAVISPFTQLMNKKVNGFFKKMNPSEAQIATYIDGLCESIWPEKAVPQPLPQSSDKNETKQKALQIMTSKFAVFPINKTDIENVFKMFQNAEENKKLVHMLLAYFLMKFLPGEPAQQNL